MKQIALAPFLALTLALAAVPATAEDSTLSEANPELREGVGKLSEGLSLFLKGLMAEMEPAADAWQDLVNWLGDFTAYEAPERLPNGDIIIRRKPDVPLDEPLPEEPGSTDL